MMSSTQHETAAATSRYFERMLQWTLMLVVLLGSFCLGLAQQDGHLPVITFLAVITSLIFTDLLNWVSLNRVVANLGAVLALLISAGDFFTLDSTLQLYSIAKLLTYLQVVLLFQQKNVRIYWQIITLSILQVIVGTALNLGAIFGFLLCLYLLLSLATLSLFFLYRQSLKYQIPQQAQNQTPHPAENAVSTIKAPGTSTASPVRIILAGANNLELLRHGLGWGIIKRTLGFGIGTLVITAVVFSLVPRSGKLWGRSRTPAQRSVGFTETVKLGALGAVATNTQPVLQASFYPPDSTLPTQLSEPPYLRGTVLTYYANGLWEQQGRLKSNMPWRVPFPPMGVPTFRQKIDIEPLDTQVLFGVYPVYENIGAGTVQWSNADGHLTRSPEERRRALSYELATTGIQYGIQTSITPGTAGDDYRPFWYNLHQRFRQGRSPPPQELLNSRWHLLQLPEHSNGVDPLADLKQTAHQVLQDSYEVTGDDTIEQARALLRYFNSPRFSYSLQPQVRDLDLDPIEDFIRNNPAGHCEYFATALTLMLRSQGIPARMVVGFRGGDWNRYGNFYQVRQLHAHTWVEVFLPDIDPDDPAYLGAQHEYGYWLRLDPTPGSTEENNGVLGVLEPLANLADYVQSLWKTYIIGLDGSGQQLSIYEPLLAQLKSFFDLIRDATWLTWLSATLGQLGEWISENWLSWQFFSIGLLSAALLVIAVRNLGPWLQLFWQRVQGQRQPPLPVFLEIPFYHQLEAYFTRQGWPRPASQTQHEYLMQLPAKLLAASPNGSLPVNFQLQAALRVVAQSYYKIRFGNQSLGNDEYLAVQQAVQIIENYHSGKPV